MKLKPILLLFLFVFLASSAHSANFKIQRIDHPLLCDRIIYAVAEEDGMVVWATDNRLVVFYKDGSSRTFDSKNSPLIEAANISAVGICEGSIWVTQINFSNGYGIFRFDGEKWDVFKDPEKEGILSNRVLKIHVDDDKVVWFGHEFQGATRMVEAIPLKFSNTKILHLFRSRLLSIYMQMTHLWMGSVNGVVRYRSEIESNYYLNVDTWKFPEFPAKAAYCITEYLHNRIFIGTDTGLAVFDGKNWQLLKKKAGIKALPVLHAVNCGNDLWLGSPVGVQCWNEKQPSRLLTKEDGLPGQRITAMASNRAGKIFIGTESGACVIETTDIE